MTNPRTVPSGVQDVPRPDHGEQPRWVFSFESGNSGMRDLLGGKGAELAEMSASGFPVPPGFTITTEACRHYCRENKRMPEGLAVQVQEAIGHLEASTGRKFGDPSNPLLVSVRSGAAISMPGMMDTVLNLGINQQIVDGLARNTLNERFALDIYCRFIESFASVVLGVEKRPFLRSMEAQQREAGVSRRSELSRGDLRETISRFKSIVRDAVGSDITEDPAAQLESAIRAVFDSWDSDRAISYRDYHGISHQLGTAVNVVSMVYGNMDDDGCTGVMFTRDPSTGERTLYGEYLLNAQGEEIVSGGTTPRELARLAIDMPDVYRDMVDVSGRLESHYGHVQEVEFTVEQRALYILQTREAKLGAKAAVKIAVDMADEALITRDQALLRVDPEQISQTLLGRLEERSKETARVQGRLLAVGLGASPGGATGMVALSADKATEMAGQGIAVILVRPDTSVEDIQGIIASAGVVTGRGGATSHAAVVTRGMGKPCVTGTESIEVYPDDGYFRRGPLVVKEGDEISIDGSSGEVFIGSIDTVQPQVSDEHEMATLLSWADLRRRLGVWANADSAQDAKVARDFGAEGIGLCRTEHMFFQPERLSVIQDMIVAARRSRLRPDDQEAERRYADALNVLEKLQVTDFEGIFRVMGERPVLIRLLDPPLHEFLPSRDELLADVIGLRVSKVDGPGLAEKESLLAAVDDLHEANPMLGLRGCRLGLMYPAIYEMQTRAILKATHSMLDEGVIARPEIMVPLVSHGNEMSQLRERLEETFDHFERETGSRISCQIGAMIETPRAALVANEIAEYSDFFSFGTNDLTQTTFGFSRDDAEGKFLRSYIEERVLPEDPFRVVDRDGVGRLIETACRLSREVRAGMSLGICGEHGGDPSSIDFFHRLGLDYVSCSPYRVPIARLAAAQAVIRSEFEEAQESSADP